MSSQPPTSRSSRRGSRGPATRAQGTANGRGSRGPSRNRAKPSAGKRWFKRIMWTGLMLGLLGIAFVGVSYAVIQTPKPNDIATAQASVIYYADGTTEMERISQINRESIHIGDLPPHVGETMLAAEDRDFYNQSGVSPKGMARAIWVAIKGGPTQGGSTITQQYVKNYFLTADQTVTRKFKEILLSIKIDQQQSKDQILENYLNTIYYGRGAYGIETAAQAYYGKPASQLTVEEAAVLASVIRGPSLYDPQLGAEQLANVQARWAYVLDGMVTEGWMTPEARAAAVFPMPVEWQPRTAGGPNGFVVQLIKKELESKLQLSESDIERGGLQIVSTIEKPRQDAAVAAVQEILPPVDPDPLQAGLASITPGDGAVVALYGGADYATVQFNSATDAKMQGGSTFKPFTLIAALKEGKTNLRSTYNGASPQFFPEFRDPGAATQQAQEGGVRNFGNSSFGTIDVPTATASSVNTVYAQLNILATPKATSEVAAALGVKSEVAANYGNVFGTASVNVLEMANAYATIAAGGRAATPYFVKSAKSIDGAFDYTATPDVEQVIEPDIIADATFAMEAVVERGSGSAARAVGRPLAGKTGTTSDNKAAWFDGFAPQLATAVGIYRPGPNGEELSMQDIAGLGEITGGSFPVRIWTEYMKAALDGVPVEQFPEPAYVNEKIAPSQTAEPEPSPTEEAPAPVEEPPAPPRTTAPPAPTSTPSPSVTPTTPPTGPVDPTTGPPATPPGQGQPSPSG